MTDIIFHLGIVAAALAGFALTIYIRLKKRSGHPMVCPLGADCHTVIHSKQSKLLGIPVELLGSAYYIAIAIGYSLLIVQPSLLSPLIVVGLSLASAAAFLFSLYLIFVQIAILRQWCTWCLCSAVLSTIIFVVATFLI